MDGKLIYDSDILRVQEYEDGVKSQLIFSTITKGDLFLDKDIVMKVKWTSFPWRIRPRRSLQLEQMEMEQHLEEVQLFKQLPRVKKTVKGSKKNSKKVARRSE